MSRYLKLVHMELHRFRYILAGLMALTAILQISSLINKISIELSDEYREMHGLISISFPRIIAYSQFWSIVPILISIAVIGFYIFVIWYRDWFGRHTFIYRLLMLPTARRHIYMAKATAIILFIFSLLSFQIVLLFIEKIIFNIMVPAEQRVDSFFIEMITANQAFEILFPSNFEQFLYSYGLGMIGIFIIFTAILLERSYRGIGIVYAILYATVCILAIIASPVLMGIDESTSYFYPGEILAIEATICVIVLVVSIMLSFRLLAKKITV